MPEHTPDTFDLDQAFRSLGTEVGERTASPGASAAIGAAHRRRTTIAAVAAAAVLAVAGVVSGQLGSSDRLSPADLPAPAPFDAGVLNAATEGFASDWHAAGKDDADAFASFDFDITCGGAVGGASPDPERAGGNLFVSGTGGYATYAIFADFGTKAAAATTSVAELTGSLEHCAAGAGATTLYGDRGQVTGYALSVPRSGSRQAWVARLDNRLGLVLVTGSGPALPEHALDDAIIAALQADASYTMGDALQMDGASGSASASPSQASEPPAAHPGMVDSDLAAALDGWSTWVDHGDSTAAQLPCLTTSPQGSSSGSGLSVGTTGELATYDFETYAAAARGMQQLLVALMACDNGPWDVDSTTVPGAVVASHPDGVVWVAQQGPALAVFTLADATDPPNRVRLAVGKLVIDSLS